VGFNNTEVSQTSIIFIRRVTVSSGKKLNKKRKFDGKI